MAEKQPIALYSGTVQELATSDFIPLQLDPVPEGAV